MPLPVPHRRAERALQQAGLHRAQGAQGRVLRRVPDLPLHQGRPRRAPARARNGRVPDGRAPGQPRRQQGLRRLLHVRGGLPAPQRGVQAAAAGRRPVELCARGVRPGALADVPAARSGRRAPLTSGGRAAGAERDVHREEAEGLGPSFLGAHALASAALLAAPAWLVWGVDALWRAAASAAASSSWTPPTDKSAAAPASASAPAPASSSTLSCPLPTPASLPSSNARSSAPTQGLVSRLPPRLARVAYAYLPLTWAATLAHYEDWGLREAGTVARVLARSLEDDGLLPRTFAELVSAPAADPAVVAFVQGATLVAGAVGSAALTRRLGARPWGQLVPHLVGMALVTAELWSLLVVK